MNLNPFRFATIIVLALSTAACVNVDDEDRVATLSPKQVKKLCKEVAGPISCGDSTGSEITYTATAEECEESVATRYQPCALRVGEFRGCIEAIRECTDGFPSPVFSEEGVCDEWIACETRDN